MEKVKSDSGMVDRFFSSCNDNGLTVIRVWGFNHRMPYAPGQYDEDEFKGLDYIVDSAARHGIYLVIALGNMWASYRSPEDFMSMAGVSPAGKTILDFYTDPAVRQVYRDHLTAMVSRVNTHNGLTYSQDPHIMLWDVMNEPNCPGCTKTSDQATFSSWLGEMASHLKAAAPNQLVTLGMEGHFSTTGAQWNPGAWSECQGQEPYSMAGLPGVDVLTTHIYADFDRLHKFSFTTGDCDFQCFLNFFSAYLQAQQSLATSVGKPLVLEEFNIALPLYSLEQRSLLFQMVYDNLLAQKSSGGPMAGVLFWSAAIEDVWDDGFNVYLDVSSVREPIVASSEGLDAFSRKQQTWTAAWKAPGATAVDMSSYAGKAAGKSVPTILQDVKSQL
ncbi:MAG: hypothetical protein WDW38_003333 [Sanguina aurantia]